MRVWENRQQAAEELAEQLDNYRSARPLVLAIPRGGVPMAKIIADRLGGELDLILVRKLGAPGHSEYAIGSVDEEGHLYLGAGAARADEEYIEAEKQRQMALIRQRRALYTPHRQPIAATDRTVIVVDDGIATGATIISALRTVRSKNPATLVAAVAVAPKDTVETLEHEADDIVCLYKPTPFYAVGAFFRDFGEVNDDEVIRLLQEQQET